jgi:hypothetical protein
MKGEKYSNGKIKIDKEKLKCLDEDSLCATLCTNTAGGRALTVRN